MLARNLRVADKTLGRLFSGMVKIKRTRTSGSAEKILVIKLWALGDTVSSFPAVRQLKQNYPKSEIHVLCTRWNLPVIRRCGLFDRIWVLEISVPKALKTVKALRKERFGIVIDFELFTRTSASIAYYTGAPVRIGFENRKSLYSNPIPINENSHIVVNFSNLLKPLFKPKIPKKLVPLEAVKKSKKWASSFARNKKLVCLHPGSAATAESRRWPVDRWIQVGKNLGGYDIVVVGSREERQMSEKIAAGCGGETLAGRISIDNLIALCYEARLFIATDSGPMHIAAACGCPTIGLFGPNSPERFGPYCKRCIGIRKSRDPPCILPFRAKFKCSHDHMKKISVEDVVEAARYLAR